MSTEFVDEWREQQLAAARARLSAYVVSLNPHSKHFFDALDNSIGPHMEWPAKTLEAFLSPHMSYSARFQCTLFALGNGCPPRVLVDWYIARGVLHDDSARKHISDLIMQHSKGELSKFKTYILPSKITRDKDIKFRRHTWDGVGEPKYSNASCWYPVHTPSHIFDAGGNINHITAMNCLAANSLFPPKATFFPPKGVLKQFANVRIVPINDYEAQDETAGCL